MSTSVVNRIYVQSTDSFYDLEPPVDVIDLGRQRGNVVGTVGEVLGSACIQHIIDAHIDTHAVYGEGLRHLRDRFDEELRQTPSELVDALLVDAFGQQGIQVTRVNEAAEAQQVRHLALVPGIVGIAA